MVKEKKVKGLCWLSALLLLLRPALASQHALLAFSGHRPWHPRAEEEQERAQLICARVF